MGGYLDEIEHFLARMWAHPCKTLGLLILVGCGFIVVAWLSGFLGEKGREYAATPEKPNVKSSKKDSITSVPLTEHPIAVIPEVIKLRTGEWRAHHPFDVHNRTNEIYHKVVVKLIIDAQDISSKDLAIQPPMGGTGLYGIDNKSNKKYIHILISRLNPQEVLTFKLVNKATDRLSTKTQPKILLSIESFEREPQPILEKKE